MPNKVQQLQPPAIPLLNGEYTAAFNNQKDNILRLFFNRLTTLIGNLLSTEQGGRFLFFPHGLFYSTESQSAVAINTAQAITFNNTTFSSKVFVANDSEITVDVDGIYNFAFTGQVDTSLDNHEITIWLRKNGVNISDSARLCEVERPISIAWAHTVDMEIGDHVEIMFGVTGLDVEFISRAASAPYPAAPSVTIVVSFVSNTP